jgi:putative hydrolase of the HAD superfamily
MEQVRAVFLDVGWTLAYPRASIWEVFAELLNTEGAATTPEACESLVRTLWDVGQIHAQRQFENGASYPDSDAEFAGMFEQLGRFICAQLDVDPEPAKLVQRFLQRFWNDDNWSAFPDVLEALAALRFRGVRVGVLSNAPSDLPVFLDRLGITPFLDFAVVSAQEGVKKPDRRIFEIALARAGVDPGAALHVGDMYLEDILGGRAAGVQTLLMERNPHALFPSFRESHGRDLDPAHVVRDLTMVLDRLM